MAPAKWRGWFLWAMLAPCVAGCQGLFGPHGPPEDPLFLRRKPLQAKAQLAPPISLAQSEPHIPANPFAARNAPAYADDNPRRTEPAAENRQTPRPVPGILTNRQE